MLTQFSYALYTDENLYYNRPPTPLGLTLLLSGKLFIIERYTGDTQARVRSSLLTKLHSSDFQSHAL